MRRKRGRVTGGSSGLGGTTVTTPTVQQTATGLPGAIPTGPSGNIPQTVKPGPPPDPSLIAAQGQARFAVAGSDAYATLQRQLLGADFGFGADGGIDPTNPFSRASLLQRAYQQNQRGTMNSYATSGQVRSTAYRSQQDENAHNYDAGLNRLRTDYGYQNANILKGQLDTYTQYGAGIDQTSLDSMLRALGVKK